jgi:hypothetical protein
VNCDTLRRAKYTTQPRTPAILRQNLIIPLNVVRTDSRDQILAPKVLCAALLKINKRAQALIMKYRGCVLHISTAGMPTPPLSLIRIYLMCCRATASAAAATGRNKNDESLSLPLFRVEFLIPGTRLCGRLTLAVSLSLRST